MNSPFKFLRRVRIHGGECGAVARALHHEVKSSSLYQADSGKALGSTIERKQMSTKTNFKRISLGTVIAMVAGLFAVVSVAPAGAADVATGNVTSVTIAVPATGRVGEIITSIVTVDMSAAAGADETITLRARFDSKPATSSAAVGFSTAGKTMAVSSGSTTSTVAAANASGNELLPAVLTSTPASSGANFTIADKIPGSVGFTGDVAGDYVVTVWLDQDQDGVKDTAELSSTRTFTVGAAATTVTLTNLGGTPAASGSYGALVRVKLTDAAGAAVGLGAAESLSFSATGATVTVRTSTGGDGSTTMENTEMAAGTGYINVVSTANATATITLRVTGSGGSIASLNGSLALGFKAIDTSYTGTWTRDADGAFAATNSADTTVLVPLGANTVTYDLGTVTASTLADDAYVAAEVTDTNGRVTASASAANGAFTGLKFDRAALVDDGEASIAVSMTSLAINEAWSITIASGSGAGTAATSHTATAVASGSVTIANDYIAAKTGGSVVITATVEDNFGRELQNALVTITSATSRNSAPSGSVASVTKSSDADGLVSFTWTDTSTSTLLYTDNITLSAQYNGDTAVTDTATVVWSATGPVASTVVLTGGNTSAGVTAATVSKKDISAGDGAEGGVQTFSATVKDAAGNLLQGVACTWTITDSGTKANVLSTKVTTYTSSAGVCSSSVYGWIAGTYTVTATAAGASGTGTITFAQTAAGDQRAISATVSGSIVTATVVDRFGNPVPGVTVYATKSGAGYFGTGVTRTTGTTDTNGKVELAIAGGDATVTVSTIDYDAVAGTYGSGQTSAPKGYLGNSSTAAGLAALALTAYTAGTATTAEEGVGASFDAAGVATATASVTGVNSAVEAAADAAAEAIDAANAATDAANLAAEAADAATVAAEEARDAADAATAAVEELATQVATLMAALKAQITTLANTVAKIAKKVKA
jgi:hypothetical protein